MNYNLGEYGQKIYVNFNEYLGSGTDLKIIMQPFSGNIKTAVATLGTVNLTIDDEPMLANQYLVYTLLDGDLNKSGQWRAQGVALVNGVNKKTNFKRFTVLS